MSIKVDSQYSSLMKVHDPCHILISYLISTYIAYTLCIRNWSCKWWRLMINSKLYIVYYTPYYIILCHVIQVFRAEKGSKISVIFHNYAWLEKIPVAPPPNRKKNKIFAGGTLKHGKSNGDRQMFQFSTTNYNSYVVCFIQ